jgi:UDP-GlcNAc:undecaprenyl-phosphate/decaprenyl-phosphate GlcNAc-1-phosphate transferase
MLSTVLAAVLFVVLGRKFNLYDHPTGRSSHVNPTLTGMGLIQVFSFLVYGFSMGFNLPEYFVIALLMIATISFIDDIFALKHSIRLVFQMFAILLMLWQLDFQSQGKEVLILGAAGLFFGIGVINAYNFMDGINGMLVMNAFIVLGSMLFLNETLVDGAGHRVTFADSNFIIAMMLSLVVSAFLNVRKKALAFMGDVGSMTISMVILFLMYSLLLKTGNYAYLLLFSIFGVDAGLTVGYKLILRQNIFIPHRDFLFKRLVHVAKKPHLEVTMLYAAAQLVVNSVVVFLPSTLKLSLQLSILFVVLVVLLVTYILLRNTMVRRR